MGLVEKMKIKKGREGDRKKSEKRREDSNVCEIIEE